MTLRPEKDVQERTHPRPQPRRRAAPAAGASSDLTDAFRFFAVGFGAAAAILILWLAGHALLIIFAGILFGVLLDAGMRGLQLLAPIGRIAALLLTCLALAGVLVGALVWGGYQLAAQAEMLTRMISDQVQDWRGQLEAMGFGPENDENNGLGQWLVPDPERLLERLGAAFATTFGLIGDLVFILFVGIFLAANPALYRSGTLTLVPPGRRSRIAAVLDESASALRYWLLGQLFAMMLIGVTTWLALVLIGVPSALLLGVQAGLLAFIPYIGPIIAAIPIALVAAAQGLEIFALAMAFYIAIQMVEGHLVTPLIHERAVNLPPLLTLAALILFGVLFGAMGVILATPLIAILRIFVLRLYVEDRLGGGAEA
jgi:predicted PurR-regulated permease PerM